MMMLTTGMTPDALTRSFLEPTGLPPIQTGGVSYMHPVRKAFGCAGCIPGVAGLDNFSTMTTAQQIGIVVLIAAAGYGGYRFMKKHRRRRRR